MYTKKKAVNRQSPHVPYVKHAKRGVSSGSETLVTRIFSKKGLSFYHGRHGWRPTIHAIDEAPPLKGCRALTL